MSQLRITTPVSNLASPFLGEVLEGVAKVHTFAREFVQGITPMRPLVKATVTSSARHYAVQKIGWSPAMGI